MKLDDKFGRRISWDARDSGFRLTRLLGKVGTILPVRKTWSLTPKSLDQEGGTCVGHAWANFLRCAPIQTVARASERAYEIYDLATRLDEWSDNDGDRDSGTSIRAGAAAVTQSGVLKSYLWSFELQTTIEWVLTRGPVVLGTNWYSSMMSTKDGIVSISKEAKNIGGHAYLLRGVDVKRGLARCENSWGDGWGDSGAFWISLRDLERLIREEGEVCTAVEQKLIATRP